MLVLPLAALAQRPGRPRLAAWSFMGATELSGAAGVAEVALGGGSQGARFGFLLAFPLTVLVLFPNLPLRVAAIGATCLVGGVSLMVREGRDPWFVVEWGVLSLVLTLLGVVGSLAFRRLWSSELEAQLDALGGIDRIGAIVVDLGRLAQGEPAPLAPFELEPALEEARRAVPLGRAQVALRWSGASGLPPALGCRPLLVEALARLIAGAVDAAGSLPDPGRRWVEVRAERGPDGLLVHVDDGGPPCALDAIGERGGGRLACLELEGRGSRVTVSLPAAAASPAT